ncbi:GmrSD restriction endonuclease domain-containing protein [Chthoniobacter flavus]|uniref:GmrSD restriction endonuclease domain-containing protein n=1 Tax=Chthoniobacter flavus TaxID=191863 RepID=UPI000A05D0E0
MRASDNSAVLKSEPFATTKAVFASCPYVLTSQVSECDDWNSATISDRQKALAQLALTAWPI